VTASNLKVARVLFAVGVGIFALLMALIGTEIITVNKPVAVNDALLGGLLSLISLYILYAQSDMMKKQVKIEDRLLAYETEPSLEVISREFQGNNGLFELTNYGHGVAQNLCLECFVECPDVEWYSGFPIRTRLHRYDKSDDKLLEDSSVRPQEDSSCFMAKSIKVGRLQEVEGGEREPDKSAFETLIRELQTSDATVTVSIDVICTDTVSDEEYCITACEDFTTDLSKVPEGPSLQEVYKFQQ
jgi:hypothetical protein